MRPLKGHESDIGPRTDKPLIAPPSELTETRTELTEVAQFLPARYKVLKKLGQGGMGTVYLCLDQALERQVAIKIMTDRYRADPQGERRFMREARAQATVNHHNVATVLNFGVSPEGRPFLVMEYLEGQDLRSLVRTEKVIEPIRACDLVIQICDGLQAAHEANLVHRDLKPSNVMIVKDHRGASWVKILDLGLAKIIGGQTDLKSITLDTAGMLVGTPAYMSPEQVAGAAVDGRADLYSVGVVFFELLTGRLPFESESMEGWLYQHLHVKPPAPSVVNASLLRYPHLDQIVLWLMAKQANERPKTARDLGDLLRRIVDQKFIATVSKSPDRGTARKSGQRKALIFEDNPPVRTSDPRSLGARESLNLDGPPPPPDRLAVDSSATPQSQNVRKTALSSEAVASSSAADRRGIAYLNISKQAESAETLRQWNVALELWQNTLTLASDLPDLEPKIRARIEGCRREIQFEAELGEVETLAKSGEWEKAEKILARLTLSGSKDSTRPGDPRVEQARARLPKHLAGAWLAMAAAKIKTIPEGDLRQSLYEQLGIAYAHTGDMASALPILQNVSRKPEARSVGLAQAIIAANQNGHHEGLRPYLDQLGASASSLTDPSERGRVQLEVGRALSAYGDQSAAGAIFQSALSAFNEAHGKGIPLQIIPKRNTGTIRRGAQDMRSILLTNSSLTGPKALRTSWEMAIGGVAQAQAENGLVDDSVASATFIEDPWILAQTLSQIAQSCAKIGRTVEAERVAGQITFAMPKTQALRGVAVSRVYRGDMTGAEELLKTITTPADRIPLLGLLATAWVLRNESGRAEVRVADAVKSSADVIGARARFHALLAAAEPILTAGFQDVAEPLVSAASKLIDLMDDAAERLRSVLKLAQMRETARSARLAATRTIVFTPHPSPAFAEPLRQATVIWLQVRNGFDRLECVERLGYCIAWGAAPDLATEMLAACRDAAESAVALIGLSSGMV